MTETPLSTEKITGYLLGTVSNEDMERLDELSITDAAFADALMVAETELLDAYVSGELDDETRRQFERHYLASPHRRDNLKFAQAFQLFVDRQAPVPADVQQKEGWLSGLKAHLLPGRTLQWGLAAASLALLVAGGWLLLQNMRLEQQLLVTQRQNHEIQQREQQLQKDLEAQREIIASKEQAGKTPDQPSVEPHDDQPISASAILSLVLTPQLRSAGQRPALSLKPETSSIAVRLVLEPNDFSTYRVALLQEDGQTVWRSGSVKARASDGGGALDIRIPAGLLKSRTYLLRVTGIATDGTSDVIGDYGFRVTK